MKARVPRGDVRTAARDLGRGALPPLVWDRSASFIPWREAIPADRRYWPHLTPSIDEGMKAFKKAPTAQALKPAASGICPRGKSISEAILH
jgi:hypothetical protein